MFFGRSYSSTILFRDLLTFNNNTLDLTTLKPENQQETDSTEAATETSDVIDSNPERKMVLPADFVVSNESDLKIANQASLSQTQIIIIGGAGGGCLLIILGTSMSLKFRYCEKATKCKKKIPPCFEITW